MLSLPKHLCRLVAKPVNEPAKMPRKLSITDVLSRETS